MNAVINKLPAQATWKHFGGSGRPAHFYHATGFVPGVYSPLLSRLSQTYRLSALGFRSIWPGIGAPPGGRDYWEGYADDLIAFLEQEVRTPVIGMGHSMGATCTAVAASKRPDLFKALVMIEPAMLSRPLARLVRLAPKALMYRMEPAKSTLRRPDTWSSREAFVAHCRRLRHFRRLGEEALEAMAQHGVVETPAGHFTLAYPKAWEADAYTQAPNIMDLLGRLETPCVAIRGKPSLFLTEALWQEWQRRARRTVFRQDLAFGHLLPLEAPAVCHELIESGLAELG